ncbi:hypothetical protein [Haloarcula sp. 1CSR25-25]|uniref:hypothetical protein n=1 Tax=Haloarcula sp. 1CSR25-25 TaxID=2862545 RepID=UPI0028953441|nr:hypothetical protein [Haloarcula sp. 1CSR25-25]MDT3433732.1 hypothetical protein [Haloarcula sp. 1CSR25-25]
MDDSDSSNEDENTNAEGQVTPEWINNESKAAIYWRAKYEEKSQEVDELQEFFQENVDGREERFVEIIRSIGFNKSTAASRPVASMGSDINVGLTAKDLIEGIEPVVALGLAGITAAGIIGTFSSSVPSIPLWVTLGSLGLSLGTGLDWYRRRNSADESNSTDRIPQRLEERMP